MTASEVLRKAQILAIQERFQVDAHWIILAVGYCCGRRRMRNDPGLAEVACGRAA